MRSCAVALLLLAAAFPLAAGSITLNFEGFPDSTILTTQYPSLTFTNAIILTAGISLNEFEFPPPSGTSVVIDDGGPLFISLATPALNFVGYFTYTVPLTVTAFDLLNNQVASATSLFSNNLALSGDPGSTPNERLELNSPGGLIYRVWITGDPAGGSFTLDDVAITTVPEPDSLSLVMGTVLLIAARVRHHTSIR